MTIDLESSLDQLARSAHDDGVAARMNGQVHRMVAQIRRRRAARYTATGVVGVGVVAAVAVAALKLADPDAEPVAPATDGSDGDSGYEVTGPVGRLACGEVAPMPPSVDSAGLVLVPNLDNYDEMAGVYGPGDMPPAQVAIVNATETDISVGRNEGVLLAAVRDGVVVALAGFGDPDGLMTGDLVPGTGYTMSGFLPLWSCDTDEPLPAGEYELLAAITVTDLTHDVLVPLVGGGGGFTISGAPSHRAELVEAERRRLEAIAAMEETIAAAGGASQEFGICGSIVPSGDDPPLALDLALGERVYTSGETVETVATVRTTLGRTVIANAPTAGALIVLTRDGVVVGRGHGGSDEVDVLDLTAEQTAEVAATGVFELCSLPGADAPEVGLAAGLYQAYAVLAVALKEVTEPGGEAVSRSDLVAVRSNPVDVEVGTLAD